MSLTRELPRYQCHKQVQALKIRTMIQTPQGFELHFEDGRFAPHLVAMEWVARFAPMSGGYFVVYDDGYQSYSPAEAFEAGYTLIDPEPVRRGPPSGYLCVGGPLNGEWLVRPEGQTRYTVVVPPASHPIDQSGAVTGDFVATHVDYVLQEHPLHGMAWVCHANT